MAKYVCTVCGYVYDEADGDPDHGVAAGTAFTSLPDDWVCPVCGVGTDQFQPEQPVEKALRLGGFSFAAFL